MKKRNFRQTALSLIMALIMCLSLPLSVLAEEGVVAVETTAGNPESVNVTITIESAAQPDGSTQTSTTTVAENQVTGSGMTVDYQGLDSRNTDPAGTTTGATKDTIINADNFLKDMDVTVVQKAEDHENNADTNTDNDAYVADLSFALVVTPSTENGDDLTVQVLDAEGNTVASGRIAGQAREGETVLTPDENGNYTFTGITLIEGNQNFNITLEGVQNLEEGVYLYTSEIREDVSSQTMVGLAGGERAVSVSMNIAFDLDVKDEVIATENVWRTEWTNHVPAAQAEEDEEHEEEITTFMIRDEPEAAAAEAAAGLEEIPDEEVPLADAPKTGDGTLILAAISVLSGMGYASLSFTTRRKEQ